MNRERLSLEPVEGYEPEIGLFLAALEDCRQRTKEDLAGLPAEAIDWVPPGHTNSIGTLLYHIAAIEMDWLFVEILEQPFPEHIVALFPYDVRNDKGQLTPVTGMSLEEHSERLDKTRNVFIKEVKGISKSEFYRVRHLEAYDVTPAWVIHHLMQHEATHRGQILTMRVEANKAFQNSSRA